MKAATRKSDGSKWAVKIIAKNSLGPEDEEALKTEVAILQKVSHPNIVALEQIFDCPKNFYMVRPLPLTPPTLVAAPQSSPRQSSLLGCCRSWRR